MTTVRNLSFLLAIASAIGCALVVFVLKREGSTVAPGTTVVASPQVPQTEDHTKKMARLQKELAQAKKDYALSRQRFDKELEPLKKRKAEAIVKRDAAIAMRDQMLQEQKLIRLHQE